MFSSWFRKGCPTCRQEFLSGSFPPTLATSVEHHAHLHRCGVCSAYWEQGERSAYVISERTARQHFPEYFA